MFKRIAYIFFTAPFIFALMFTPTVAWGVDYTQEVSIQASTRPLIDIVVATGVATPETLTKLKNFSQDIKAELNSRGLDADEVSSLNVQTIESTTIDMVSSFSWNRDADIYANNTLCASVLGHGGGYGSSSIGSNVNYCFSFKNNGRDFQMNGNPSLAGKAASWVNLPVSSKVQKFSYSYNLNFGDNFNSAGMLLNIKDHGLYLTGNIIQMGKSLSPGTGIQNNAIGDFVYYKNQNRTNISVSNLKPITIAAAGSITVTSKPGVIQYQDSAGNSGSVPVGERAGSGFGFYSDHYSHGCTMIGEFIMSNLALEETSERSLSEVLSTPTFRPNSNKVLMNVSSTQEASFGDTNAKETLLNRLLNENIDYLAWGSTANQAANLDFLQKNDNRGEIFVGGDYTTNLKRTADYLQKHYFKTATSDTVVRDYPISIDVTPTEFKTNTADATYPNGRWKVVHNSTYYNNSEGLYEKSGIYQPNMPTTLNKPGEYDFFFQDKQVKTIYVHRKPIADFIVGITGGTIQYQTSSFDPDTKPGTSTTEYGLGIKKETWSYRTDDTSTWIDGKPANLAPGRTYQIRLQVEDVDGAVSDPVVKMLNTTSNVPVAGFTIDKVTYYATQAPIIKDASYSPNGDPTSISEIILVGPGLDANTKTYTFTNIEQVKFIVGGNKLPAGEYRMSAKAKNNTTGTLSAAFSRIINILHDTTPPAIIGTSPDTGWVKNKTIDVTLQDDESKIVEKKYVITKDGEAQPTVIPTENSFSIHLNDTGKYSVTIETKNEYGLTTTETLGEYRIDNTIPTVAINSTSYENNKTITVLGGEDSGAGITKYGWAKEATPNEITWIEKNPSKDTVELDLQPGNYVAYSIDGAELTSSALPFTVLPGKTPLLTAEPAAHSWTATPKLKTKITLSKNEDIIGSKPAKTGYFISETKTLENIPEDTVWAKNEEDETAHTVTINEEKPSGSYYIHVFGEDNKGNTTKQVYGPYQIDTTVPQIIDTKIVYQNKKGSVKTVGKDEHSGIKHYMIHKKGDLATQKVSFDGMFELTSSGAYIVTAVDNVGNISQEKEIQVIIPVQEEYISPPGLWIEKPKTPLLTPRPASPQPDAAPAPEVVQNPTPPAQQKPAQPPALKQPVGNTQELANTGTRITHTLSLSVILVLIGAMALGATIVGAKKEKHTLPSPGAKNS